MAKKEKSKTKPSNNELATKVLEVMKTLKENGVTEFTSTLLKDKLGTKNRSVVRRVMNLLAEEGKVVIGEKEVGKRKQYTYRLA